MTVLASSISMVFFTLDLHSGDSLSPSAMLRKVEFEEMVKCCDDWGRERSERVVDQGSQPVRIGRQLTKHSTRPRNHRACPRRKPSFRAWSDALHGRARSRCRESPPGG